MAASSFWFGENWFNLIQTFGIVGGLIMTAQAAQREARAREIENLLTIAEHHRELWSGARQRKELRRIFQDSTDKPMGEATLEEEEFLNLVITHFHTSWSIARIGGLITLKDLADDAKGFFALPLPRTVWEKTKHDRNRKFVGFIDRAISR